MRQDILRLDGTFNLCKGCTTTKDCCTGKVIDRAVLTPNDVKNICSATGLQASAFSINTKNNFANIKLINNNCYFYKYNKCTIYNIRPLDCRLFPFDIRRNESGELILVYYNTVCPSLVNIDMYEEKALFLLSYLGNYLEEYADHGSPLLDQLEYKVVTVLT
jgi:Fe-S-cluster containining protein